MLGWWTRRITEISRLIWSIIPTRSTFSLSMTLMATMAPVARFLAWYTFANVPCPSSLPSSYRFISTVTAPFFSMTGGGCRSKLYSTAIAGHQNKEFKSIRNRVEDAVSEKDDTGKEPTSSVHSRNEVLRNSTLVYKKNARNV